MVTILFADFGIFKTTVENTLLSFLHLRLFDFRQELRNQLWLADNLTLEMKSYVKDGMLIPTATLEKFINKYLLNINGQDVLFSGYPITVEQFQGLEILLKKLNIPINAIWFFRQKDPYGFMQTHFAGRNNGHELYKYTDMAIKWQQDFGTVRNFIDSIRQIGDQYKWRIIDIDHKHSLTEESILQKIKDIA